ncbi:hypothetical protein V1508DRAFT_357993 [Lipomyces doorenjongii]|uniref:uncharacterized protein n=1 Tax=Lipomyces doorenjongii TaxID=383834 RepID=UPI0034CE3B7A
MDVAEATAFGRGSFRTLDTQSSSTPAKSPRFTFVHEKSQAGIRSHAMREYWKQRHKTKRGHPVRQTPQKLLPRTAPATSGAGQARQAAPSDSSVHGQYMDDLHFLDEQGLESIYLSELELLAADLATDLATDIVRNDANIKGVPVQALTGMNHALAAVRFDPFDTCPVKLTTEHQKLLHHWLSTHATMMFEELTITSFNPMRDVWFPLDLSNASSFNTVMAHSAAHLAYLQGGMDSVDALRYKAEAMRILNIWLGDPTKSLSDEAFAAVVRLLTFERYWGTEAEWRVHRDGLQGMIEARGGLAALQDNWRLGLIVCLVSLMAKPSWFDSSNRVWEISEHSLDNSLHPMLASIIDLHKIYCLWLISFIQDMRTLMRSSSQLYQQGLRVYPAVHDAVLLLHFHFQLDAQTSMHDGPTPEYDRLACLLFISVLLQESMSSTSTATLPTSDSFPRPPSNSLAILDVSLQESRNLWEGSVANMHLFLFHHFMNLPDGSLKTKYAVQMTDVLGHLSLEARRGVEKCLLNLLCGTKGGKLRFSAEDSWTPDSLLSSMHGE